MTPTQLFYSFSSIILQFHYQSISIIKIAFSTGKFSLRLFFSLVKITTFSHDFAQQQQKSNFHLLENNFLKYKKISWRREFFTKTGKIFFLVLFFHFIIIKSVQNFFFFRVFLLFLVFFSI